MMGPTKESDLVCAVLLYAARCRNEGDRRALRAMSFGTEELEALDDLGLSELMQSHRLRAHCLDIRLNRAAFWPMVEQIKQWRISEQLQRRLIHAGAPADMMRDLFGMDPREHSQRCHDLGVPPMLGRPLDVDEACEHRLWEAWTAMNIQAPVEPETYLDLAEQTNLNVRDVWRIFNRWSGNGQLE